VYEQFNLNGNPFEIAPITYDMAGRKKEWEDIKKRLGVAFSGRTCKFIIIKADYGLGKTFTVNKLYTEIKEKKEELKTIVVKTLAGQPIQALQAEPSKGKFALDLITRIFKNLEFEQLREITKKIKLDSRVEGISKRTRILFQEISKGNHEAVLILTGEPASAEAKELEMKTIKTSEEAKEIFREFLILLKLAGYENLLIILDEFEYIMTQSTIRITIILQTLRELFDEYSNNPTNMAKIVIVFTVSPGGWDRLSQLEVSQTKRTGGAGIVPFKQRIDPRDIILLSTLSPSEVEEMIAIRLQAHRYPPAGGKLSPFTKEAIKVIAETSKGVPRLALVHASILLDNAIERKADVISEKDAKEILAGLNIYVQAEIPEKMR